LKKIKKSDILIIYEKEKKLWYKQNELSLHIIAVKKKHQGNAVSIVLLDMVI
jgi:hypothetical protein